MTRSLIAGIVALSAAAVAQQTPPVFRSVVELVQLDVSVFDKERRPVRGLTQADFTLFEDGKPQSIEAFSAVDLEDVERPSTKWMRDVTPDVTTNEITNQRLIVIVLGERLGDLWGIRALKESATKIIDRLRPDDLATVLYTNNNTDAQNFTSDHAKLLKAVNAYSITGRASRPCALGASDLLARVTEAFDEANLPGRRKTIILLSHGIAEPGSCPDPVCGTDPCARMLDVLHSAQRANVNVYPINVMGLGLGGGGMQTLADNTGGRAVVNTNEFDTGINQIFVENSSYYLLGYTPTNVKADGTFRKLEVKVNRPDLEVRTRRQYIAPRDPKPGEKKVPTDPAIEAMSSLLPRGDLPLRVTAAPFVTPGSSATTVAIALGLRQPALTQRLTEEATLTIRAFTNEGDPRGSADLPVTLNLLPARRGAEFSRYDLIGRIDLKPGRYEVRVSAKSAMLDKLGSVYADVDVPDFQKLPLSMSGVLMNVTPGVPAAPAEALSALAPITPTTERDFLRVERVAAFLRVYQTGKALPVTLKTRVVDAGDKAVVEDTKTLAVDQFKARAADISFPVPVAQLAPGDYLLSFEVTNGKDTARRDVRFRIRINP